MNMKNNILVKLLCSIPIIIIATYFLPFLGIILILFRFFVYNKKRYNTAITLIVLGLIILLPKLINYIIGLTNVKMPYLEEILNSSIYPKFISLSKILIILGVILIIISYISKILGEKLGNAVGNYFKEEQRKEYEISEKNDLKMQEKREIAKNTHFVKCPNCGGDNTVVGNVGKCKFCRRDIEYKP